MAGRHRDPEWSTGDLDRRLCHALNFARLAVQRLGARGYSDLTTPINDVRPEKVVSEAALLLFVAGTARPSDDLDAEIHLLAQLLIPYARGDRMLLGMCLEPALALDYAQGHICLARSGYPDAAFDAVLECSRLSQASAGRERTPHRMLEQGWLHNGWLPAARPGAPRGRRDCVLTRPMDLLGGSREDLYAFTHALMYLTDFNVRPRRLPRGRSLLLAEATAALARCLDDDDYDLAGELLLAWPLTGTSWSGAATFAFRVLATVEDEAGFLPSPSTRLDRLRSLDGIERTDYFAATAYHTVFVMGLLCAVALQPGRTPPAQVRPQRHVRGSAEWFLRHLGADDKNARWRKEFDGLEERARDGLSGLLLNMALHRRVKARDFAAVFELLAKADEFGLGGLPMSSQAAELLQRMAAFTRVRGSGRGEQRNRQIGERRPVRDRPIAGEILLPFRGRQIAPGDAAGEVDQMGAQQTPQPHDAIAAAPDDRAAIPAD
jgi:hypothetical protein